MQDVAWFDTHDSSALMSRVEDGIVAIRNAIGIKLSMVRTSSAHTAPMRTDGSFLVAKSLPLQHYLQLPKGYVLIVDLNAGLRIS